MADEIIAGIMEVLAELNNDTTVPRNVKQKLGAISTILKEPLEMSIKVDKALQEIEEVSDDSNLQPHVRTQIWNVVSMLEKAI